MGHLISSKGVEPDPEKVQGITGMPAPTNKSEILTLQGSDVMQSIRELTKDDVEFVWGKKQEEALEMVKKLVTSTPILAFYDSNEELVLHN